MSITATPTGISIYNSSLPISSIVISGDDDQTLDMSLLNTSLSDIDSGTDYTLSLENVFNGNDVFVFLSAESEGFFMLPVEFDSQDKRLIWPTPKDPADIERYPVDFASWLIGDNVVSATFAPPEDSGLIFSEIVIKDNIASAMISGGVVGTHYIDVTLTTDIGRKRQRSVKLRVKQV